VLGVYAVLIAPVIEETLFRGVLLRSFMRRLTFWSAAVVSSAIFGALHTYEVSTLAGRITLAVNVGLLGVVNCLLARITGRLTPAIMLHATGNLFAFLVVASP
jgi:membrane protease YdiL (CAAX protease family)